MSLRKDILECERALTIYAELCTGSSNARIFFAVSIHGMIITANGKLRKHIESLDRNECTEVLGLDFNTMKNPNYWLHNGKVKQILEALPEDALDALSSVCDREHLKIKSIMDIYLMLEDAIMELTRLLCEVREKTMAAPLCMFENYFHKMCSRVDEELVSTPYMEWKMGVEALSFDLLKNKQTLEVANFLNLDTLRFANPPVPLEMTKVDLERVKQRLPYMYELPTDFVKYCAKFKRYISWSEDILQLDCGKMGKYLFMCDNKLYDEEIEASYKLYIMLQLIHKDMVRLRPELAQYLEEEVNGNLEGTRYFAIAKQITLFIDREWFYAIRTNKKYNSAWVSKFVNGLLSSEWREHIAEEWRKPDKELFLKACIIGCLKEAKVIKGSDMGIAASVIKGTDRENKTFATYMGNGKKMTYCEWICQYPDL